MSHALQSVSQFDRAKSFSESGRFFAFRTLALTLIWLQVAMPMGAAAQTLKTRPVPPSNSSPDNTMQGSGNDSMPGQPMQSVVPASGSKPRPEPKMETPDQPPPEPDMSKSAPVTVAPPVPPKSTAPLGRDEMIMHVLNRFTYGPRPGELQKVRDMGLGVWLTQQLNPWKIDDSDLTRRLADYPAMQLPLLKLMELYPANNTVRAAMDHRASIPSGEAEKAIYAAQMERYKVRKERKDGSVVPDSDPAPLPTDPQSILAMEPAKRFSLICKLTVPQLRLLRRRLPEDQRPQLTAGFTPQQIEAIAAFEGPEGVVSAELIQTKLLRDLYSERQLNEMMVDFWLNHFNVYLRKSQEAPYFITSFERDAIRPRAMGKFEYLLEATAMSPAMLNYLDNSASIGPHSLYATNERNNSDNKAASGLNENYARELMELHTLGVNGGYTQHDVTEVAKVFTGWTVGKRVGTDEAAQAQFDPTKHEPGAKHVLGVTIKENGSKEGMQVLHLLATSPATARFVSTKLAIRFVSDNPTPAMIDSMAAAFTSSEGNIRMVLLAMIQSPDFFSRASYRAKVKTPQDYVLSAVRASGAEVVSTGALAAVIAELGMPLYGMITPQGYSMSADAWNNTAALVSRMNFALALSTNRVTGVQTNWPALVGIDGAQLTPEQKDVALERRILHMEVSPRTRQTILTQIKSDPVQQEKNLRDIAAKGGRDPLTNVRIPRDRNTQQVADNQAAIAAGLIFGSPEFQRR